MNFEDVNNGAMDKIAEAKKWLGIRGFTTDLPFHHYERISACGFDKRTLPQSIMLAQILEENHPITVRGVFYRAVSIGLFPNTSGKYYRQVGNIVLKLRRGGVAEYSWVSDSTRTRNKRSSWSGLEDFAETVQRCYRKNFWAGQKDYVEVAVEKDAMAGVLRPITDEYDIHLNVIRGNCSETFVWNWAEALKEIEKPIHLYYLGDHDPNGLDIERDLRSRLEGFMGRSLNWQRLAVTTEDFHRSDLIGFPTRQNKSKAWNRRCREYIQRYGDRCIEVDAIVPAEIRLRLQNAIEGHIDWPAWRRLREVEELEKESIKKSLVLAPNFGIGGAA